MLNQLYQELMPAPPNGLGTPGNVTDTLITNQQRISAAIAGLGQPALPADFANQVAQALAANQSFLDAVATAVAHKQGAALSGV